MTVNCQALTCFLFDVKQVVGDEDLAAKFEESALTIRRDIVFAASLYI